MAESGTVSAGLAEPAIPSAQLRRGRRRRARLVGSRIAVVVVLLAAWQLAALASDQIAPVVPTFEALADDLGSSALQEALSDTLRASIGGFLLAAALALPLGMVIGRSTYLRLTFDPIIAALFSVPRILIYPVMLAAVGIGTSAKLYTGAIAAFFPMLITTIAAVRAIDPILLRVARSLNANRRQVAGKVLLPATIPSLVAGLRLGFSVSFVTVVLSEMFVTTKGLGAEIRDAYGTQRTDDMFAVVTLALLCAIVVNMLLWSLERRLRSTGR